MRRRSTCLVLLVAAATLIGVEPAAALTSDGPCSSTASGDFNGDGFTDLAIGVPDEDVGTITDAGAVNVLYGTAGGLSATNNQLWHQDTPGVHGAAEAGDRFGACLAAGNFDGDTNGANRIDDLAIGVPGQDVDGRADAGAVAVIYGSRSSDGRLDAGQHSDQIWTQNFPGIAEVAETGDAFGSALAAGDFNGDGRDDLAVGVPREDIGSITDAGVIHIFYATEQGLHPHLDELWHQNVTGIADAAESNDRFGTTLAAGLFNDDARADLAVGSPGEDVGTLTDAGAVNVLYGGSPRMTATGNQLWTQNSDGVPDDAETNDFFGRALAAGDFGGTAHHELAVGTPGEDLASPARANAGAVVVLAGSAAGLTAAGSQLLTQDAILSTADTSETGDLFGSSLAAANFGDGAHADLAVGVPSEDDGALAATGAVDVVYGTPTGLNLTAGAPTADFWTQGSPNVEGTPAAHDNLGSSLTVGNFNGDTSRDLVIGVPLDDEPGFADAGLVHVIYGTGGGLDPTGPPDDQLWHQGIAGILGDLEANDMFGSAA